MSNHQLPTLKELHQDVEQMKLHDKFNELMSQPPPKSWLKRHKYIDSGKYEYLPIDKVEFLLKRIFGTYQVEVRSIQQMFNSVVVTVRVHVKHPITGEAMWQDGIGAKAMQLDKDARASDMSAIKAAAVEMGAPNAESIAVKDAAEKWGAIFGKDLNKDGIIPFQGAYDQQEPVEINPTHISTQTPF